MPTNPIALKVLPRNFASGPPFPVDNQWRPGPVTILSTTPEGADVIAAPMPTRGGMRIIVYNREPFSVEVVLDPVV